MIIQNFARFTLVTFFLISNLLICIHSPLAISDRLYKQLLNTYPEFEKSEKTLNTVWKNLNSYITNKKEKSDLLKNQKAWLSERSIESFNSSSNNEEKSECISTAINENKSRVGYLLTLLKFYKNNKSASFSGLLRRIRDAGMFFAVLDTVHEFEDNKYSDDIILFGLWELDDKYSNFNAEFQEYHDDNKTTYTLFAKYGEEGVTPIKIINNITGKSFNFEDGRISQNSKIDDNPKEVAPFTDQEALEKMKNGTIPVVHQAKYNNRDIIELSLIENVTQRNDFLKNWLVPTSFYGRDNNYTYYFNQRLKPNNILIIRYLDKGGFMIKKNI